MQVTVIYPIGSLRRGDDPDRAKNPVRTEAHAMRIEIPDTDDPMEACEIVWRYMNYVDGSDVESQLRALGERSMMMGDQVVVHGQTYQCMMVGFQRIDDDGTTVGIRR